MFRKSFKQVFRSRMLLGVAGIALGGAPVSAQVPDWIVNDFESGTLNTPMNGFWYFFTDRNTATAVDTVFGNSTLTMVDEFGTPLPPDSLGNPDPRLFPPGRSDSSTRALKFGYVLGDRRLGCGTGCTYDPYVGFGFGFSTITNTLDFSTSGGIAFWARAEKDSIVLNVSVAAEDTTVGAPDYSQRFVIDTTWKRYKIDLVASTVFKQPNYGPRKPFNATLVKSMNFGVNKGENSLVPANSLFLDDVVVIAWEYVDPSGVRRQVAGRAAPRVDFSRRNGKVRFMVPGLQGKGLAVDAAGRIQIPIE